MEGNLTELCGKAAYEAFWDDLSNWYGESEPVKKQWMAVAEAVVLEFLKASGQAPAGDPS
jgi:hypothetical protein